MDGTVAKAAAPAGSVDADRKAMLLARGAVTFLMLWPAAVGFVWLWFGLAERMAIVVAVGISSLLFWLAAPVVPRTSGGALFRPWQLVCVLILAAVYLNGLIHPAHDPDFARPRAIIDFLIASGAIAFVLCVRSGGEPFIRSVVLQLIAGMVLYLVFFAAFAPTLAQAVGGDWTNAFLPFINVRRFTNSLAPIAVAALGLIALHDGWGGRTRAALWMVWIAFAAVFFWTGGRAPILAIIGAVLVVGALLVREARLRLFRTALIGALAGSAVSLVLPRLAPSFGFWQRIFEGFAGGVTADEVSSYRLTIWRETVDLILARPWFGYGPNQWALQRDLLYQHGSVHNFPLQVLHDFGIVGGVAAMALVFGTTILNLRRVPQAGPMFVVVVLMIVVMVLQSFLDSIFYNAANLQIALFAFAMAHALGSQGIRKSA